MPMEDCGQPYGEAKRGEGSAIFDLETPEVRLRGTASQDPSLGRTLIEYHPISK